MESKFHKINFGSPKKFDKIFMQERKFKNDAVSHVLNYYFDVTLFIEFK